MSNSPEGIPNKPQIPIIKERLPQEPPKPEKGVIKSIISDAEAAERVRKYSPNSSALR